MNALVEGQTATLTLIMRFLRVVPAFAPILDAKGGDDEHREKDVPT